MDPILVFGAVTALKDQSRHQSPSGRHPSRGRRLAPPQSWRRSAATVLRSLADRLEPGRTWTTPPRRVAA